MECPDSKRNGGVRNGEWYKNNIGVEIMVKPGTIVKDPFLGGEKPAQDETKDPFAERADYYSAHLAATIDGASADIAVPTSLPQATQDFLKAFTGETPGFKAPVQEGLDDGAFIQIIPSKEQMSEGMKHKITLHPSVLGATVLNAEGCTPSTEITSNKNNTITYTVQNGKITVGDVTPQ